MKIRNLCSASLLALLIFGQSQSLLANSKIGCKEVDAIAAKCGEFDTQTKACADLVQVEGKKKIDAAKQEQSDCKTKHGAMYLMKCKNEVKKATTLVNTPKALLNSNVEKEQAAVADSSCAKAKAIGSEQALCKGPKKVIDAMKANCVKDM